MDHYPFYVLMPSPTLQPFGLFCFQNFFYIGTRQFTRSFIFCFNSIFVPAVASFSAFISLFLDNGRLVFPLAPYFSLFSPFLQVMAGQVAFQPHVDSFFLLYIYIYTHTHILNTFLVSSYYLVHNISVTSICVVVQVYVPITLFVVHFFSFNRAFEHCSTNRWLMPSIS